MQMQKLLQQESTVGAMLYQIELVQVQFGDHSVSDNQFQHLTVQQQQSLQSLLEEYEVLFSTPNNLPPHRIHDHVIPLVEGHKPPNNRPYGYGPVQKSEIEKCVNELSQAGFIRVSNSPYLSPVILVRKKEGT